MLFEIHLVSGKSLDLFPYVISADMGQKKSAKESGVLHASPAAWFSIQGLEIMGPMSGRLGGGPWRAFRIN